MKVSITYDDTQWQLVPKEPTIEQQDAMVDAYFDTRDVVATYKAGLSAAPTPPAQPADEWEKKLREEIDHAITNDLRLAPAFGRITGDPAVRISDLEAIIDYMTHARRSAQPAERRPQEWMPIETAPEGVMVVVFWREEDDVDHPERHDFDVLEDGLWQRHYDDYEHYLVIGGPSLGPGPKEKAPYTHWMPLPAPPENGIKGES